ncbi:hypothetical protein HHK36_017794 [Tetracentron sinense]|uniref:Uncharacterized protein n=1 Tax=Tetracentron sinense TaxID=13715 RepID=A0A835DAP2_TETSI|nr:hypothetical protein HHK36_017794 [Tetracentron sinense]
MENPSRIGLHDFHLASRKAEEAAWRRFQAAGWLKSLVGPLGLSNQPSEQEFISCLRNGLVLCNAINKIQPGSVPKVVEICSPSPSLTWEAQPLPAYQYFENVRNFLVAVEELKLPAFEASDIERDTLEAGSTAKVVDCILALKSYHEWKQVAGGNGTYKHARSPMVPQSASRTHSRVSAAISSDPCRRLDMSTPCDKPLLVGSENRMLEDALIRALTECLVDTKENIDENLLASFHHGNQDPVKLFSKIMSSCLEEQQLNKFPECCKSCLKKGNCNHLHLLEVQENDLLELKVLLSSTRREFDVLQSQLQSDLKQLGSQVQELSTAALGYQRVVRENRNLYNMVQDLKGNIRVYCRIRPAFSAETKNSIDFIGEDGSLVVVDPLKSHKDARKVFHFNRVFGPTATQEEVFKDTQPFIRSVMDGYNVCIFAYGQTGSGKTYTMCGPSGGSTKDMGINYLALDDLFQISCRRKNVVNYDVRVQMVEIYNDQIRNCTGNGGLSLPDAIMHPVKSTIDILNLMKLGETNRIVSSTAINNLSSRSHSILTVHVQGKDISGSILRSCLHLVDLAGSERVDKSEVTGDRLKEAQHINKSLSCLGDVITALAQKNSHIPYRNSKLTQLLQDSLGGHAKTLMFAHVSPEGDSFGETISTLKFAQRVSTVELGAARLNKESCEVRELKEQVESLKKALASKEAQNVQLNKAREPRSPCEKPKTVIERTPPRPRRLSIESSSIVKTDKVVNPDNRRGSKTPAVKAKLRTEGTPTHSRRLSLEGPKYGKNDQLQIKEKDVRVSGTGRVAVHQYVAPCPILDVWKGSISDCSQCQNDEAIISSGKCLNGSSLMTEVYRHNTPRSPGRSTCHSTTVGKERRIPTLQLPKTPEQPMLAQNEVPIVMQTELGFSNNSQTPSLYSSSTRKKGSQIRKSLQTIGKLINGSERRNQQYPMETPSPINGASKTNGGRSPVTDNARALRRQSLTSVHTLGSDRSRRSSLGGKSADPYTNETRNARTPPPVHSSTKMTKQWM